MSKYHLTVLQGIFLCPLSFPVFSPSSYNITPLILFIFLFRFTVKRNFPFLELLTLLTALSVTPFTLHFNFNQNLPTKLYPICISIPCITLLSFHAVPGPYVPFPSRSILLSLPSINTNFIPFPPLTGLLVNQNISSTQIFFLSISLRLPWYVRQTFIVTSRKIKLNFVW